MNIRQFDYLLTAAAEGDLSELPLVLIIEDEFFLQADVEAALAIGGFATDAVFTGEEGMALFVGGSKTYDALVSAIGGRTAR